MSGQVSENVEHVQFQRVLVHPSLLGHLLIGQGMDGPGLARVSLVSGEAVPRMQGQLLWGLSDPYQSGEQRRQLDDHFRMEGVVRGTFLSAAGISTPNIIANVYAAINNCDPLVAGHSLSPRAAHIFRQLWQLKKFFLLLG